MSVLRAFLAAWLIVAAGHAFAEVKGEKLNPATPLPAFKLQDQHGRTFTVERLRGRWSLVLIGYTSCPDVCPFTLANLAGVLDEMGRRAAPVPLPQVVFIAVDPARDKPLLGEYVGHFHADFVGITGSHVELERIVAGVGGAARIGTPHHHGDYMVTHSAAIAVVDPDARLVARLYPPLEPGEAATYLLDLARGAKP